MDLNKEIHITNVDSIPYLAFIQNTVLFTTFTDSTLEVNTCRFNLLNLDCKSRIWKK